MDVDVSFHCSCCFSFWQGAGGHGPVLGWQLGGRCCPLCVHWDWEQSAWVGRGEAAGSVGDRSGGRLQLNCSKAFGAASPPVFPELSEVVVLWVGGQAGR